MHLFLLPGMDGTGLLFGPLRQALPPELQVTVVRYPAQEVADYDELAAQLDVPTDPFVLVAESFSGPIAARVAARWPAQLRGMVLVNTFVAWPGVLPARWVTALGPRLFGAPIPGWVARWLLLGTDAPDGQVRALREAIASVAPAVLAGRLRGIASADARRDLARCQVPVLILTGTRDHLVSAPARAALGECIPDAARVLLEGPHLLLQARPEAAAAEIVAFLRRIS